MTTIGIFIDNESNLFQSGAIQQALFTYLVIKNTRHDVIMLAHNSSKEHFSLFPNIPVKNISVISRESVEGIKTLIFTSVIPSICSSVSALKSFGIKIIYQICGNYFIINQEDYIFDCHKRNFFQTYHLADEIWLLPMYKHMQSYIKTITKKNVIIVPYIWNNTIIHKYAESINVSLESLKFVPHVSLSDWIIYISEPNVSIHKTSLVPILIAEENFQNTSKDIQVLSMCSKDTTGFKVILQNLEIFKYIQFYPRANTIECIRQLKNKKIPICISHQIFNELNFLHLEMMYLGYPLVHNSTMIKPAGFYYKDHDTKEGSDALQKVYDTFVENYKDIQKGYKDVLSRFDPNNENIIEVYRRLLT